MNSSRINLSRDDNYDLFYNASGDYFVDTTTNPILKRSRYELLVISAVLVILLLAFSVRIYFENKKKKQCPYLLTFTIAFLTISNVANVIRLSLMLFAPTFIGKPNGYKYILLRLFANVGLHGSYWMFAHRYWELSIKVE